MEKKLTNILNYNYYKNGKTEDQNYIFYMESCSILKLNIFQVEQQKQNCVFEDEKPNFLKIK